MSNSSMAKWLQYSILTGLVFLMVGCGGTLSKTVAAGGGGTLTPTPTPGAVADPTIPKSIIGNVTAFKPTTRAAAASIDTLRDPASAFGANALMGYPGLGDVLSSGLFMNPSQQGLALDTQFMVGSYTIQDGVLVPTPYSPFLAHLGRSNEHVYLGGELDVSIPGSYAEFFLRHHDPNRTRHCLAACRLSNENGQIIGRLQSDVTGTTTTLGTVYLTSPRAAVECVAYKDTLAMYINGRLAAAVKDPQPINRQALFGISANNGKFRSLSAANLETLRNSNQITFYDNDFTYPSGSVLPIQFEVTGGGALIGNGEVVPYGGASPMALVRNVDVADVDVSMDFKLSYNSPRAAIIARSSTAGHYRAEVNFGSTGYTLSIFRSNQTAAISGPYTLPAKSTGTLRFTLHREELRAYVDNQLYAAASDSTAGFGKGRVGFLLKDATTDNFLWKSFY